MLPNAKQDRAQVMQSLIGALHHAPPPALPLCLHLVLELWLYYSVLVSEFLVSLNATEYLQKLSRRRRQMSCFPSGSRKLSETKVTVDVRAISVPQSVKGWQSGCLKKSLAGEDANALPSPDLMCGGLIQRKCQSMSSVLTGPGFTDGHVSILKPHE